MALEVGSRLGHYDVTALIGEGGMGQVYRATDTQLGRDVALKILPDAFAADPDRLARFEREAKVLASLNHPNIGHIYGLEETEGTKALVLELVEGPTLADRIADGPIPIDEALPIAKQIAEALEAAHDQGIIHRDLKPANVKVKADGTVKVLDFGLAKALVESEVSDPALSPTATVAATASGVILGTAGYMSPEQARGKAVDKRADIWAFGAVLYEMLTGQRPFHGRDVSETLAAIMMKQPEWPALPTTTPTPLQRLLRRCLEKDSSERLRDIGEARIGIKEALTTPAVEPVSVAPARASSKRWAWGLGGVAGIVLSALVGWFAKPTTIPEPTRFVVNLPATDELFTQGGGHPAVSPDGRTLVYVAVRDGVRQLFRRSLDQLEATPILGTDGARAPFFSPDGQWVGFLAEGESALKKVLLAGGPPATVWRAEGLRGASWGAGEIIFRTTTNSGLFKVSDAGGEPEALTSVDPEQDQRDPDVLPGGDAVLFTVWSGSIEEARFAVLDLESGTTRVLGGGSAPRFAASGHIVFNREDSLWAVPFDVDGLAVTGDPIPVLEGAQVPAFGGPRFAVAAAGSLAYSLVRRPRPRAR